MSVKGTGAKNEVGTKAAGFRLPVEIHRRLEKLAKENQRSISNMVLWMTLNTPLKSELKKGGADDNG